MTTHSKASSNYLPGGSPSRWLCVCLSWCFLIPAAFATANTNTLSPAYQALLKPYQARYDIIDGDDKMGTASRTLKPTAEGRWQLSQSTTIRKWYYKYFFEERSLFTINDQLIQPLDYHSITKRSFKDDRVIESQFDWQKNQELGRQNNSTWTLDLPNAVYDHLSYQLMVRLHATSDKRKQAIRVSYKGELTQYIFINEGSEEIETPLGKLKTVVWSQQPEYQHGKSITMWLAPELGFVPIKIAQYRGGKLEGTIQLKTLTWL
ncbi:MAG: DUF3108 domain-containing protein [Gammaproteobacteria bacterium]|nr:DUF3108 domain-containing protein [Gammaproteobacteria bacterium]